MDKGHFGVNGKYEAGTKKARLPNEGPGVNWGMSSAQVLELLEKLPFEEQREVFEQLREKFDDELTPGQTAELELRAAEACAHPERCRPLEDVFADIEKRYRAKP